MIVIVLVVLVVGFFWFVGEMDSFEDEVECRVDEDCVKVQVGCCGCNMGGVEKCVAKSFEGNYLADIENCSDMTICAAVDNCEIESCGCVDGRCIG